MSFAKWLSDLLKQHECEVERILSDPTAQHFLITWALFESKCFEGFLRARSIRGFAKRVISESFPHGEIDAQVQHFHERYQGKRGKKLLENLLHGDRTPTEVADQFKNCIDRPLGDLPGEDRAFVVAFVVYRYRNNMFHGTKGVQSWLKYQTQIEHCVAAMQAFITHAERQRPTLAIAEAA